VQPIHLWTQQSCNATNFKTTLRAKLLDLAKVWEDGNYLEGCQRDANKPNQSKQWELNKPSGNQLKTLQPMPRSWTLTIWNCFNTAKCNKCFHTGHITKACRSKAPTMTRTQQAIIIRKMLQSLKLKWESWPHWQWLFTAECQNFWWKLSSWYYLWSFRATNSSWKL